MSVLAPPTAVVNVSQVRQLSPFRYPGGKTWLVPEVRSWLTRVRPDVLLEPFAGGGAVGLAAAAEGLVNRVVLVELDADVAAVWQVIVDGSDADAERLCRFIGDFEVRLSDVRHVLDTEPLDVVGRAFRTVVRNRCQHGGVMAPGAGLMSGLATRWYPDTLIRRIRTIRSFRQQMTFLHGGGLEAIRGHQGAAMFVDPPYTASSKSAGSRLYAHHEVDHARLFKLVDRYAHAALMTYDDTAEVRSLADRHRFRTQPVPMKSNHHRVVHELLIEK